MTGISSVDRGLTVEEAKDNIGREVEYMPGRLWAQLREQVHPERMDQQKVEYGTIYRTNKRYVFVQFSFGTAACVPGDLIFADDPRGRRASEATITAV